jgi:hypothetical protein
VFEDATSWAASSMSTNWSRDAESTVSVPFTHRGLDLRTPRRRPHPPPRLADGARVRRHDVLGGLHP